MISDLVRYPGYKRDYRAYVVRPKVAYTSPAILLLHDRWGLTEEVREFAHRLVHEGYVVMVPDLYDGKHPQSEGEAKQWMHQLTLKDGLEEVRLALAWLRNQAYTKSHLTSVVGFEHHGTLGLLSGILPRFHPRAIVLFCSPVSQVIDQVRGLHSAVQAHFGERDRNVPRGDVEAFQMALATAGVPYEVHIYAGLKHDFVRPGSKDYSEEAARLAWERMLSFLSTQMAR